MPREVVLSASYPHPADRHLSVVLCRMESGKWATWVRSNGADAHGHYFRDEEEARVDWAVRVGDIMRRFAGAR